MDGRFTFSHDKIRACLYAEVSTSRRRRLHEAIGKILEERYEQGSKKSAYLLASIAFHFTRSGDTVRAVTYAHQAAEQALRSFAVEEARSYYQMALDLLEPDDQLRGDLLLGLGEASLLAGLEDEAIAAYEGALAWFSQPGELEIVVHTSHGLEAALALAEELQLTDLAKHMRFWLNNLSNRSSDVTIKPSAVAFEPADATFKSSRANLTRSEAKVVQLVVKGKRNREIAKELCISEKTVANHLSHIFSKTTCENRAAVVAFAMRHGLA
jgi:DNA-binding CsgD family transcriptional regulator